MDHALRVLYISSARTWQNRLSLAASQIVAQLLLSLAAAKIAAQVLLSLAAGNLFCCPADKRYDACDVQIDHTSFNDIAHVCTPHNMIRACMSGCMQYQVACVRWRVGVCGVWVLLYVCVHGCMCLSVCVYACVCVCVCRCASCVAWHASYVHACMHACVHADPPLGSSCIRSSHFH